MKFLPNECLKLKQATSQHWLIMHVFTMSDKDNESQVIAVGETLLVLYVCSQDIITRITVIVKLGGQLAQMHYT